MNEYTSSALVSPLSVLFPKYLETFAKAPPSEHLFGFVFGQPLQVTVCPMLRDRCFVCL